MHIIIIILYYSFFLFYFSVGEKNIGPIYAREVGQRRVAPSPRAVEIRPSAVPLRRVYDRGAQHVLPQVLSLDPAAKPLDHLPIGSLVAHRNPDDPRV